MNTRSSQQLEKLTPYTYIHIHLYLVGLDCFRNENRKCATISSSLNPLILLIFIWFVNISAYHRIFPVGPCLFTFSLVRFMITYTRTQRSFILSRSRHAFMYLKMRLDHQYAKREPTGIHIDSNATMECEAHTCNNSNNNQRKKNYLISPYQIFSHISVDLNPNIIRKIGNIVNVGIELSRMLSHERIFFCNQVIKNNGNRYTTITTKFQGSYKDD